MNWIFVFDFLTEIAYVLFVFVLAIMFAIFVGRQAIMNLTVALYLALLIAIEFPNYNAIFGAADTPMAAATKLGFFVVITLFTTALCYRIMPREFRENRFESIGRKLLLAFGVTILIVTFSFNVFPVAEFLTPGTPIQSLFAPQAYFFWWLLVPLVILYVV